MVDKAGFKPESKKVIEGRLLADHMLGLLRKIMREVPAAAKDSELQYLCESLDLEIEEPSDETLEILADHDFPSIAGALARIDEAHKGLTFIGAKGEEFPPEASSLFPSSFEELCRKFDKTYKSEEAMNACELAAEAIVMGEATEGLEGLAYKYRAFVREIIFSNLLMVDDNREELERFLLMEVGEEEVVKHLALSGKQIDEHPAEAESTANELLAIILEARDNIEETTNTERIRERCAQIRASAYKALQNDDADILDLRRSIQLLQKGDFTDEELRVLLLRGLVKGTPDTEFETKGDTRRPRRVEREGASTLEISTIDQIERRALERIAPDRLKRREPSDES